MTSSNISFAEAVRPARALLHAYAEGLGPASDSADQEVSEGQGGAVVKGCKVDVKRRGFDPGWHHILLLSVAFAGATS